jgi:hypothetical protein
MAPSVDNHPAKVVVADRNLSMSLRIGASALTEQDLLCS